MMRRILMSNAQRIILILALIAIFVILAQRLDNFTGQEPTPPPPSVEQALPEPAVATPMPEGYPPAPAAAPTEGSYPVPPTATPTPEGYTEPGS
jgi:hypothetical protein